MGRIETGVDRLVNLVGRTGRISTEQAAKELGVSKLVVTEWAEFLSDEKLIELEYTLSKTYMKPKKMTAGDVNKKAKNYANKKDAFVRKVDTAVEQMNQQKANFEDIKREFDVLRKQITSSMSGVKDELKILKKYENLKSDLDADLKKQTSDYEEHVKNATSAINHEKKRYMDLIGQIDEEERRIATEEEEIKTLQKIEDEFTKRAESLHKFIEKAKKEIRKNETGIEDTAAHIKVLKKDTAELKAELAKLKKSLIDPLEQERETHQNELNHLRDAIIAKVREVRTVAGDDFEEAQKTAKKFQDFLDKRLEAEEVINEIDNNMAELQMELETLRKSAISFKIASKDDVTSHLKELEAKYNQAAKKRDKYRKQVNKLLGLISGK